MKRLTTLFMCAALLCPALALDPREASASAPVERTPPAAEALAALPMAFEPNVGQTDERVRYVARGRGYTVFLTDEGATLSLAVGQRSDAESGRGAKAREAQEGARGEAVRLTIAGARREARLVAGRELAGRSNYLTGSDPEKWRRNIPTYDAVRYEGVYEGVDAVFYGNQQNLEYDFVVAPGADPSQVRVRFEGQKGIEAAEDGSLVLKLESGEARQLPAVVYQEGATSKREIEARYVVEGDGTVSFALGDYDRTRPLTIDPVIVYEHFLGGGRSFDEGDGIAVDANGFAYVTGFTDSSDLPVTPGAYDAMTTEGTDSFLYKLTPSGEIVYASYLGGTGEDYGFAVAVDSAGAAYVVGSTSSLDFPVTPDAFDATHDVADDGFVVKFTPDGTSLEYASLLGGTFGDRAVDVAVSGARFAVAGETSASNFPTTPGAYSTVSGGTLDAFLVVWDGPGAVPAFSTYLGGTSADSANSVAIGSDGSVFIAGSTFSPNLPTTLGAFDETLNAGPDAFITRFEAAGTALLASSYLGGSNADQANAIEIAPNGDVVVAGITSSENFPVTSGAFDTNYSASQEDGFVARLDAAVTSLVYSTYLGGTATELIHDLALDSSGAPHIVGWSRSSDYPTTAAAVDGQLSGENDVVVTKLSVDGSTLVGSTYLGGSEGESGNGIDVDASGSIWVVGLTTSLDYPHVSESTESLRDGLAIALSKISPAASTLELSLSLGGVRGSQTEYAGAVAVDAEGAAYVTATTHTVNYPTSPGSFQTAGTGTVDGVVSKVASDGSLVYSTFIGASDFDTPNGLAVTLGGEAVVVGYTMSADFPVTDGAYDTSYGDGGDIFGLKLDASGSSLVYSTFLGGPDGELALDVALDGAGTAYITGFTSSADFPTTTGAFDGDLSGFSDAFVVKLAPDGGSLLASTLLGGDGDEYGESVAVDGAGGVYVAVSTLSLDYPVTAGALDTSVDDFNNGAVTKLTPSLSALIYSTYLGGGDFEELRGLEVDGAGNAFVAGITGSDDFPVTPGAFDVTYDGGDGFVAKLNAEGTALVYATYVGGSEFEFLQGLAVDAEGAAYVTGTVPSGFPTTPDAPRPSPAGDDDAFLSKLSPSGNELVFSTYLGGSGMDAGVDVAVGQGGQVVVYGDTTSSDFAVTGFGIRDYANTFLAELRLGTGIATAGIFVPSTAAWFLKNENAPGDGDEVFVYGVGGSGFVPLAGDWDGDGRDTAGLYDPASGTFFLKNAHAGGDADHVFIFGAGGLGYVPISGDWDGDGLDTVGLYHPPTGSFFLRNALAGGTADESFFFGAGGGGFEVVVGDWDGDGVDTIGLYRASTATFFLIDEHATGPADHTFIYGGAGLRAIAGDWNGDGVDTIGVVDVGTATWFLKNTNAFGTADVTFIYGVPGVTPLAGNWDGQ